jgi:peptide/nickel transport system substrate-binding protein
MRSRRLLILLACLSLLLAGCSSDQKGTRGEAERGGSVSVALAGPVGTLDPALARTTEARRAAWLVYTPPLTYRHRGGRDGMKIIPGLVASLPKLSDDKLTLTMTLLPDLYYSGGRPVKAPDVERGIARSLRLDPKARERFGAIAGARAFARGHGAGDDIPGIVVNAKTGKIRLELEHTDPRLPEALATTQAAPVPPGTAINRAGRVPPPGVGPFRIARSGPRTFTLVRVDGFQLGGVPAANVDVVSARQMGSAAGRTRAVLRDRADVTEGEAPLSLLPSLRSEYGANYSETPTLRVLHVRLDNKHKPFNNPDVRHALSYALDERALGRIWAGLMDPTCNLLPPQLPDYERAEKCPYGDREGDSQLIKARNLVDSTRFKNARVIVWGGDAGPRAHALAAYLADRLDAIDLRARVARTPKERRRANAVFGSAIARSPDPEPYVELPPGESPDATDWAELDRTSVADGSLAPYGVATDGVLLSKRLDADNCRRVHPLYGLDYSSLCLR